MAVPFLKAQTLAELNEFAHAPYVGARLPDGVIVPQEWCAMPQMRGYVMSELRPYPSVIATHESALWIHTGIATLALERALSFAHLHDSQKAGARRESIPRNHIMQIGSQHVTTPERTAVDLLTANTDSGVAYLASLLRAFPRLSLDAVQECAWQIRSKKHIGRVRQLLDQLSHTPAFNAELVG